jgi:phosphohistidine phosphatase SixA
MQPHHPSIHALAERVAKLETQNRRLKQAGIAALVLASAAVLMGQR